MAKVQSGDKALFRAMVAWMAGSGQLPADQTYQVLKAVDQVLDLTRSRRTHGGLVKDAIPKPRAPPQPQPVLKRPAPSCTEMQ